MNIHESWVLSITQAAAYIHVIYAHFPSMDWLSYSCLEEKANLKYLEVKNKTNIIVESLKVKVSLHNRNVDLTLKWAMSTTVIVTSPWSGNSLILTLCSNSLLWSVGDLSGVEPDQILLKTLQRFWWHSTWGIHTVTLIDSIGCENQPLAVHMESSLSKHQQSARQPGSHAAIRLLSESESPSIMISWCQALCLTLYLQLYGYRWLFLFHQYTT